jgi:hypothetical protein
VLRLSALAQARWCPSLDWRVHSCSLWHHFIWWMDVSHEQCQAKSSLLVSESKTFWLVACIFVCWRRVKHSQTWVMDLDRYFVVLAVYLLEPTLGIHWVMSLCEN